MSDAARGEENVRACSSNRVLCYPSPRSCRGTTQFVLSSTNAWVGDTTYSEAS